MLKQERMIAEHAWIEESASLWLWSVLWMEDELSLHTYDASYKQGLAAPSVEPALQRDLLSSLHVKAC
jgi:hypothetical protein